MASIKIKGKLYDSNIKPFIKYLAEKYPVPVDVIYEFVDVKVITGVKVVNAAKGSGVAGYIKHRPDKAPIKIAALAFDYYIDQARGFKTVLETVAHEYCHAIQYHNYSKKPSKDLEPDARWFGRVEVEAALKEGVIAYP